MTKLDAKLASRMGGIVLGHVAREYPHKLDHVMTSDADALPPRVLHPIFFGSFDWHSCVHGWWTLLTLRRLFPHISEAAAITELADGSFTAEKVGSELAYLDRPLSRGSSGLMAGRGCSTCISKPHGTMSGGEPNWSRWLARSPSSCGAISTFSPIRSGSAPISTRASR